MRNKFTVFNYFWKIRRQDERSKLNVRSSQGGNLTDGGKQEKQMKSRKTGETDDIRVGFGQKIEIVEIVVNCSNWGKPTPWPPRSFHDQAWKAWKGKIPSSYPKMVEFIWLCLAWPNWPIVIDHVPHKSPGQDPNVWLGANSWLSVQRAVGEFWGGSVAVWQCGSVGRHFLEPETFSFSSWKERGGVVEDMFTYSGGGTIVLGIRKTRVHSRLGMIMRSFSPSCIIADMKRAADDGKPFAKLLFWLQTVVFPPNRVMQKKPSVLHKWKVILPVIGWPVQRNLK